MNTQKSVFNKISKIEREVESKEVELSEVQKVELSLLDDLDSGIGEASRWASVENVHSHNHCLIVNCLSEIKQYL